MDRKNHELTIRDQFTDKRSFVQKITECLDDANGREKVLDILFSYIDSFNIIVYSLFHLLKIEIKVEKLLYFSKVLMV